MPKMQRHRATHVRCVQTIRNLSSACSRSAASHSNAWGSRDCKDHFQLFPVWLVENWHHDASPRIGEFMHCYAGSRVHGRPASSEIDAEISIHQLYSLYSFDIRKHELSHGLIDQAQLGALALCS